MKGYNKKLIDVYAIPLPFIVKPLPPLILHNPVSVVMYIWAVLQPNPVQPRHSGAIVGAGSDGSIDAAFGVRVADPESAMNLWQQGFFGKGSLSRSEPSWFGRTARRLGLDGGELTLEEITEMRRAKRRQFKQSRELQQQQELLEKKRREGAVDADAVVSTVTETEAAPPVIRQEDLDLVRGDTIERLEYLHLTPCEAVFLNLGLGVLDIPGTTTSSMVAQLLPSPESWHEYVTYHYFRSLGWCVRDGVKFGSDFLLYRRGPPFLHAEFAVMVMDTGRSQPWWWLHSNMRVLGGAKKTLTLVFVENAADPSEQMPDWQNVNSPYDFRKELSKYTVKPVIFSRFAPSKNRD